MVRRKGNKWQVVSEDGGVLADGLTSEAAAEQRERELAAEPPVQPVEAGPFRTAPQP